MEKPCGFFYNLIVMRLTDEDLKIIRKELDGYLDHPEVRKMLQYKAHGKKSVFAHCISVVVASYKLNKKYHLNADLHTLLVGALLHDLYLYDWHDKPYSIRIFEMHGYTHPEEARKNAVRIFDVDEKIQEVIKTHMWPLTLRSFPGSKEAAIVCIADKLVATRETLIR